MGAAAAVYAGIPSADVVVSSRYGLLFDRLNRAADLLSRRTWSICRFSSRCSTDSGWRGGLPLMERDPAVEAYPPSEPPPNARWWLRRFAWSSGLGIMFGQVKDCLSLMGNDESNGSAVELGRVRGRGNVGRAVRG